MRILNVYLLIALIELAFIATLAFLSRNKYGSIIKEHGELFQFSFMASGSLFIIDKLRVMERFSTRVTNIHHKIIFLFGSKNGFIYTKLFIAQLISAVLLFLLVFTILAAINNDSVILTYGVIISVTIPFYLVKDLERKIQKKQRQMIIELPEFLNKVTLLVSAGETIKKAIIRSVEQKNNPEKSYLYKELLYSVNQLHNNYPFQNVLEELSKRCGLQEVSLLTTTILLNYRRGGDEFVIALNSLSLELWERRKAMARILGEQASSKLVFPMVLIFLVVMAVIATPALMLF